MKKRFFLYIALILLMAFAVSVSVIHGMWFCTIGAGLLMCVAVYVLYRMMVHTRDMLNSEKYVVRKAQNELNSTEAQLMYYKRLMDKVDTAVIVCTEAGHVEWMNENAKDITTDSQMLPAEVLEALDKGEQMAKIGGKEYVLSHTVVQQQSGMRRIVAMKNIHSAMEKSEVDSWHRLVRVLTHEIMNSISPILSLSETLCDMADDANSLETMQEGLGVIRRRSQGLLTFVENYRKLTRIAMPQKTDVDVRELFADLKNLFTQPFVTFSIEGDDPHIHADRSQMEQVLINLLKNAVESFGDKEQRVACSFRTEDIKGKSVSVISVEDSGSGILPEVLERIFVPFFTTKKNGSGIGLSLCKQIIMNHGGEISVESEDGKGTTVEIRL